MLKSTKCQVPVPPTVIQAAPSSSVAPLLYALPTASTVVSRPPAAPDPVTALQPTSATSKDATLGKHLPSLCHDSPLDEDLSNEDLMPTPTTQLCTFTDNPSPELVPTPMPKNFYPEDAKREVLKTTSPQSGTMDGDNKESHGKSGDNPMSLDLAILCNDQVPPHTPEVKVCAGKSSPFITVGELTFGELIVEEPASNEPDLFPWCTKSQEHCWISLR